MLIQRLTTFMFRPWVQFRSIMRTSPPGQRGNGPSLLPLMGVSFRTEDRRKLTTPAIDGAKVRWLECWKTRDVCGMWINLG